MYRLMVVDDDEFICRGIAQCIDWKQVGFGEVLTAFDGALAIEKLKEKPADVILMDLYMPFVDGIELACEVAQNYPDTRMVILSAYRDFEKAQDAIRLNVIEYLTKPFKDEDLICAVQKALTQVKAEREHKRRAWENSELIRKKMLLEWLTHGVDEEKRPYIEVIFGAGSHQTYFCVGILYVSSVNEDASLCPFDEEVILRHVWKYLDEHKQIGSMQLIDLNDKILFLYEAESREKAQNELYSFCLREIAEFTQLLLSKPCFISIAMGSPFQGIDKVNLSYREARQAGIHRNEYPSGAIIRIGDIHETALEESTCIIEYRERLADIITRGERERLRQEVEALFDTLEENHIHSPSRIQLISFELAAFLYRYSCDSDEYEQMLTLLTPQFCTLQRMLGRVQIREWLINSLNAIIDSLESKRTRYGVLLLAQAREYIDNHYQDPGLSMVEVAQHVNISVRYLSLLFREYNHLPYTAYLTRLRLERAKLLLANPRVRLFEVANSVGYNSQQYFSTIFKKNFSCTPSEYRTKEFQNEE